MSKYITLQDLQNYAPVDGAWNAAGSIIAQDALNWAEGMFERLAASQFDQQTEVLKTPSRAWFSRNNELTLIARERGPVSAVTAVQVRIPGVTSSWVDVAWGSNDVILPPFQHPPTPGSWTVTIMPTNLPYVSVAADNMWARWTYTGGYDTTPDSLVILLERLAWWKFKLREAPLGRINSEMFGTREIIQALPNDIRLDIKEWAKTAV